MIIPYSTGDRTTGRPGAGGPTGRAVWASPAEEIDEGGGMGGAWGPCWLDAQRRTRFDDPDLVNRIF